MSTRLGSLASLRAFVLPLYAGAPCPSTMGCVSRSSDRWAEGRSPPVTAHGRCRRCRDQRHLQLGRGGRGANQLRRGLQASAAVHLAFGRHRGSVGRHRRGRIVRRIGGHAALVQHRAAQGFAAGRLPSASRAHRFRSHVQALAAGRRSPAAPRRLLHAHALFALGRAYRSAHRLCRHRCVRFPTLLPHVRLAALLRRGWWALRRVHRLAEQRLNARAGRLARCARDDPAQWADLLGSSRPRRLQQPMLRASDEHLLLGLHSRAHDLLEARLVLSRADDRSDLDHGPSILAGPC